MSIRDTSRHHRTSAQMGKGYAHAAGRRQAGRPPPAGIPTVDNPPGGGARMAVRPPTGWACLHPPTERRGPSPRLTISLSRGAPIGGGGEGGVPPRPSPASPEKRSL